MTVDSEVRWSMQCIYDGEAKWCVEAVQIGGIKSGRGAIGTWFPA